MIFHVSNNLASVLLIQENFAEIWTSLIINGIYDIIVPFNRERIHKARIFKCCRFQVIWFGYFLQHSSLIQSRREPLHNLYIFKKIDLLNLWIVLKRILSVLETLLRKTQTILINNLKYFVERIYIGNVFYPIRLCDILHNSILFEINILFISSPEPKAQMR